MRDELIRAGLLLPVDLFDSQPGDGRKRILVTAGKTFTPIDKVRGIDNVFKGRTGAEIAQALSFRGHQVVLLTSHDNPPPETPHRKNLRYRTYGDLFDVMAYQIQYGGYDVVIHSAAVSDYKVEGTYHQIGYSCARHNDNIDEWHLLVKLDPSGKIGSDHPELWMKLEPTEKIVDKIRKPWGFQGTLIKFKLQVGMADDELEDVARRSMEHSNADYIVANTLEDMNEYALIINAKDGHCTRVCRGALARSVADCIDGMT